MYKCSFIIYDLKEYFSVRKVLPAMGMDIFQTVWNKYKNALPDELKFIYVPIATK